MIRRLLQELTEQIYGTHTSTVAVKSELEGLRSFIGALGCNTGTDSTLAGNRTYIIRRAVKARWTKDRLHASPPQIRKRVVSVIESLESGGWSDVTGDTGVDVVGNADELEAGEEITRLSSRLETSFETSPPWFPEQYTQTSRVPKFLCARSVSAHPDWAAMFETCAS